jgi:hypothetical protein
MMLTLLDREDRVLGVYLSVPDVGNALLKAFGHDYEIRPAWYGAGYDLWLTPFAQDDRNLSWPLVRSAISSPANDADVARAHIMAQVVTNADWWFGCKVVTTSERATHASVKPFGRA